MEIKFNPLSMRSTNNKANQAQKIAAETKAQVKQAVANAALKANDAKNKALAKIFKIK